MESFYQFYLICCLCAYSIMTGKLTAMRRMQISTTVLVTSIAFALVIGFFISPPVVTPAAAAVQTTSSPGKTSNTAPT